MGQFVKRIESTDDVIFLTVNSLPPNVRERAENLAPSLLDTLMYDPPDLRGVLAPPAYLAANELTRELLGSDPFSEEESDLRAADDAVASGLMRFAGSQVAFGLSEASMHTVDIGVTLAAGWLESSERVQLK